MPEDMLTRLGRYQHRVRTAMQQWLPPANTHPTVLHESMRYTTLSEGKHFRPILVYATGEALDINLDHLDGIASAVEIIHAYSLIHDDLPAMDNDDLRRGQPTCHRVFGEAMAILAGDALQALSFHIIAHDQQIPVSDTTRIRIFEALTSACGSLGMAGGQAIDLISSGKQLDIAQLENMHIRKTGALIRASVRMSALCKPDLDADILQQLEHYAKCIGLAFQIHDDILDVEGDTEVMGKMQGSDIAKEKPTYPALLGLDEARKRARELADEAVESLLPVGDSAETLRWLANYVVTRSR